MAVLKGSQRKMLPRIVKQRVQLTKREVGVHVVVRGGHNQCVCKNLSC